MQPSKYILDCLEKLKGSSIEVQTDSEISELIFMHLMSKKFRKYAAQPHLIEHIKNAIQINIEKNEPIKITFLHGAYKLWRLEEAPEADWAELFAAMYYTAWLVPICNVYSPGVWFDFFVDDLIVPKLDNIPLSDVEKYIESFQNVLDFLNSYQPANMKMTITRVGDQFPSPEAFEKSLSDNIAKVSETNPTFTERQLEMVELNAKPTELQLKDPKWREKIHIIHDAYLMTKREPGYHFRPDKILAFSQPLPSGTFIAVGTTKTSIAKFWVGVGVLKKEGEKYKQYILSPKQLLSNTFIKEDVEIDGLSGKNFNLIRVLNEQ